MISFVWQTTGSEVGSISKLNKQYALYPFHSNLLSTIYYFQQLCERKNMTINANASSSINILTNYEKLTIDNLVLIISTKFQPQIPHTHSFSLTSLLVMQ